MMRGQEVFDDLMRRVGETIAVTDWWSLTQTGEDEFARLTDEWDPMHNDPDWAAAGPWGGTIVHGFHVLCRVHSDLREYAGLPLLTGDNVWALNYGLDRVRFISPLRVGQRARTRIDLASVEERQPGEFLVKTVHTVEPEGSERPFMVAEVLTLFQFRRAATEKAE
jgi:acyl dehydratase